MSKFVNLKNIINFDKEYWNVREILKKVLKNVDKICLI